jgi:hypothetical protein
MDRPAKLHQDSGAFCEICLEFNGERTHVYVKVAVNITVDLNLLEIIS